MIRLKKKTWRHDNKDDEMKQEIKMLATLGILSLSLPACSGDNGETGGDNINPSVKSETMVGKNTSNEKTRDYDPQYMIAMRRLGCICAISNIFLNRSLDQAHFPDRLI